MIRLNILMLLNYVHFVTSVIVHNIYGYRDSTTLYTCILTYYNYNTIIIDKGGH